METLWLLIYVLTGLSLTSGALIWFILPRKWIAWSQKASQLLPQETIPPWRALNKFGKFLYLIYIGSGVAIFAVLIFGTLME